MRDGEMPGRMVYDREGYSVWEVDGEEYKLFTQNLSLFAKLFLDNKSVFFDVSSFFYYLLVHTAPDTTQHQIIGFFSKEKMSWDNNNLACILVFPPWLRKGLGKILMGVSYELSKREGRIGGPEKPLSDLGRRGYLRFWSVRVVRAILSAPAKKVITVNRISEDTFMLPDDVIAALKEMAVLNAKKKADGTAVVNKAKVREWANVNNVDVDLTHSVSADGVMEDWMLERAGTET
ncbi:MAG: hypothetical protein M1830_008356 [Pleopsidium flavum]|nr:MAG: hypothetical protein M1830_008356 [Pleopsidium flavum]